MAEALEYSGLTVVYPGPVPVPAVRDVDLAVGAGEIVGIAGESGSGKTTLAHAALGLSDGDVSGSVRVCGLPVSFGDDESMRSLRGVRIALAPQQAARSLDPVHRAGNQVAEAVRAPGRVTRREAEERARSVWGRLGLGDELFAEYPHRLSGGQARRAVLAMAFATDPDVVVLDEPTSGLDAADRDRLRDVLDGHRRRGGSALVVSHDLAVLRELCDRLVVLYAGRVAEVGPAESVVAEPRHPYSWALVRSYPWMDRTTDLAAIRGPAPEPGRAPAGCAFHTRCTQVVDECRERTPPLERVDGRSLACHLGGVRPVLEVDGLRTVYRNGRGLPGPVTFRLLHGEVVAVVGGTGSGKSTLALSVAGVLARDAGTVRIGGAETTTRPGDALRAGAQLVFQDPHTSISMRERVLDVVSEPLAITGAAERRAAVSRCLDEVGLPTSEAFLDRRAHTLSGGQLQRVALARALTTDPRLIIADEPTAMLDASEQARLIRLLATLQNERGMAILIVSHDLGLIRKFADRVLVLDGGHVVEQGPTSRIVHRSDHHVTRDITRDIARRLTGTSERGR